jgi:hypothetical protein
MGLDIRWPIGLMFSLVGILMFLYGLITGANAELYKRSLGINVNLYWGLFLTVFGGTMLWLAWRGSQKQPPPEEPAPKKPGELAARR